MIVRFNKSSLSPFTRLTLDYAFARPALPFCCSENGLLWANVVQIYEVWERQGRASMEA